MCYFSRVFFCWKLKHIFYKTFSSVTTKRWMLNVAPEVYKHSQMLTQSVCHTDIYRIIRTSLGRLLYSLLYRTTRPDCDSLDLIPVNAKKVSSEFWGSELYKTMQWLVAHHFILVSKALTCSRQQSQDVGRPYGKWLVVLSSVMVLIGLIFKAIITDLWTNLDTSVSERFGHQIRFLSHIETKFINQNCTIGQSNKKSLFYFFTCEQLCICSSVGTFLDLVSIGTQSTCKCCLFELCAISFIRNTISITFT